MRVSESDVDEVEAKQEGIMCGQMTRQRKLRKA